MRFSGAYFAQGSMQRRCRREASSDWLRCAEMFIAYERTYVALQLVEHVDVPVCFDADADRSRIRSGGALRVGGSKRASSCHLRSQRILGNVPSRHFLRNTGDWSSTC